MLNVYVSRGALLDVTSFLGGMDVLWELKKLYSGNADYPHCIVIVEDSDIGINLVKVMLECIYWKDCIVRYG
jgi:hypothetical protein